MAVYKGILKMVGTSRDEGQKLGGVYSVIEIGDDEIRNVQVSDVLDSYLRGALGKDVELLVTYGNSPSRKRLLALRVDGKIKKDGFGLYYTAIFVCVAFTLIGLISGWFIFAAVFAVLSFFSYKMVADLKNFA